MSIKKIYNLIFTLFIITNFFACNNKKDVVLPNLKETFLYTDTNPFGASVAYSIIKNNYSGKTFTISKKEFADNYDWLYEENAVYYSISKNYYPSERDIEALMDFVKKGNTAFISANNFEDDLLSKLEVTLDNNNVDMQNYTYQQASVVLLPTNRIHDDSTSYYYYPFTNNFTFYDSTQTKKLGINKNSTYNFFAFNKGKGRLYIHCEPRAFSNYFLLSNNNYLYLKQIIQMIPTNKTGSEQAIFWDNYYVKRNYPKNKDNDSSSFSEIFKHPPLKAAFWILFALLILYMLFNSKRKQRIVPVVKPTENSTIAFAEAIAGLYLSKKDNKIIAEKIITYHNEQIRAKYFINTNVHDATYADVLSRKAGVPLGTVNELAQTIQLINNNETITDTELLLLNGLLEKFNKKQ